MGHIKIRNRNALLNRIFGDLEGNALDCVIIEPLWAVFGGMLFFYQPLFMKSLGVSELQMGFINSLLAILQVFTSFIAGPVTDRLGRKRASLIFDIICWTIPMIIWTISKNFWFFLIAVLFNSFTKVSFTAWTCLSIEDTPEDKRVQFFGLIMIINLGAGIFTPVTGFLISKFGTISAMRAIYLVSTISMTTMFLIRNSFVDETKIGKYLMKFHTDVDFKEKCADYVNAIKFMFTKPVTLITLIIMVLTNFQVAFQFFNVMYLKDTLKINASLTSLYPGISAVIYLIIYFFIIPVLMNKKISGSLSLGLFLCSAGAVLFLVLKPGTYFLLIISIILSASGNMIMQTFRDTLWNNVIGETERAKIFSACQGIISIVTIPAGIIAGSLYSQKSIYPFIASALIFSIAFIFSLFGGKAEHKKEPCA